LKKNSLVIGICGGSGSGKTSIINALKEAYADSKPTVLSMDNYYFPIDKQQVDENGKINFDLPESLDREALYRDLLTLLRGESVEISEYGFNHREHDSKLLLEPSEIILIEGLFLFYYSEIASLLDYSIFIDVPEPIQLERGWSVIWFQEVIAKKLYCTSGTTMYCPVTSVTYYLSRPRLVWWS
jgi:uridine kinase